MDHFVSNLLFFYGSFLILCGITAVIFIGMKAKTALVSGGTSGVISFLLAYFIANGITDLKIAGLVFSLALFIVFSWRATKTLFSVFSMIQSNHPDLKGKGIAFLIIALMAVVSIITAGLQLVLLL